MPFSGDNDGFLGLDNAVSRHDCTMPGDSFVSYNFNFEARDFFNQPGRRKEFVDFLNSKIRGPYYVEAWGDDCVGIALLNPDDLAPFAKRYQNQAGWTNFDKGYRFDNTMFASNMGVLARMYATGHQPDSPQLKALFTEIRSLTGDSSEKPTRELIHAAMQKVWNVNSDRIVITKAQLLGKTGPIDLSNPELGKIIDLSPDQYEIIKTSSSTPIRNDATDKRAVGILESQIAEYERNFKSVAGKTYDPVIDASTGKPVINPATGKESDIKIRNTSDLPPPEWKPPMEAIETALALSPWEDGERKSPGWGNLDREAFWPHIQEWLTKNRITAVSQGWRGYDGWTADVFQARVEGVSEPQFFRIGTEAGAMPHLDTPWNPFILQPHDLTILSHEQGGENYRLALSRFSGPPMLNEGQLPGFDKFLNDHILPGTPWKLHHNKDWSILSDGTPINGDSADSLGFVSEEAKIRHAREQWNPEYQQEQMRIIHENSERAGVPESMRWVAQNNDGTFATKQSVKLTDPVTSEPPTRSIVRVESSAENYPVEQQQAQQQQQTRPLTIGDARALQTQWQPEQRPPYTPRPLALGEDRPFYNTTVDLVLARQRLAKISPAALERFEDILYRMDSKPSMFDRNAIGGVVNAVREGTETYNTDRVWESVHMRLARAGTGDEFKNQLANDIRQLQYDMSAFDASPPSNPAQTGFESNRQTVRLRLGELGASPPTTPMQMALPPGTAVPEIIGAYEMSVLRAREALKNSAFPDAAERFDKILLKVEQAPAEARPALREAMAALAEDSVRGEWKNSTNVQLLEALRLLRPKGKFTEPPLADDVRRFQNSLQVIAMDARDNGGLAANKPVLRTEAPGSVQIISTGQEEPEIAQAREALLKSGYPTIAKQFDAVLMQVNGTLSNEARPAFRKAIAEMAHNSANGKSSWTVDARFHESILSLAPGNIGAAFDTPLGEAMHELRQNLETVRDRVKAGAPGEKLSIERSSQPQSQKESNTQATLHEQGIGDPSQRGPFGKGGPLHRIQLAQPEGAYDRGYVPPPKTVPSTPIIADTVKTASSKPVAAPMQSAAPASETAPSVPALVHEISAPVKPAIGATETWNPRMQGMNSKIGTAAIVINLADAALKKDPRKAVEVGGTALAMHAGMKVAGKVVGAEMVPVVGEVVGGIFAGKDAYDAAKSGHTTRAAISGIEATLYTVSATAGAATLADCWNPTVIAPAAVALVAGGAAVTITAAKGIYDNWNTVKGWFGHHEENHDSPASKPVAQTAPAQQSTPVATSRKSRDFSKMKTEDTALHPEQSPQQPITSRQTANKTPAFAL